MRFIVHHTPRPQFEAGCPARKERAITDIAALKPDVLFVANLKQVAPDVGKVVMFAPPPSDKDVRECFSPRNSPDDCVMTVQTFWLERGQVEKRLAGEVGGVWFDPRPLVCVGSRCPAFAAGIPTKFDLVHLTDEYSRHFAPAAGALLSRDGVERSGVAGD